MRKEAKKEREISLATISGYHCGDYDKFLLFASDRPIPADENYRELSTGKLLKTYGFEWETQCWGINSQTVYANVLRDIVFSTFHKDLWKIERDGSLNHLDENHNPVCDTSAECITQAMTKAYIRNHYRDFKRMWEYAKHMGIDCEKTADCGMHIHISNACFGRDKKTQDEAIRKFLYVVNKHYDLMLYLLHRNPSVSFYCGKMRMATNKGYCQTTSLTRFYDDHHVCINMGHYEDGNIELRLVGGQKDFPCFRNTFESVFHIVDAVKRISWNDCDDVTKIFKGCNQYVFDRLKTYVYENRQISSEQLSTIRDTIIREELL